MRSVPAERRRIGMVFQDYALFPHMDVAANVGYALGRRPDRERVEAALETVGLGGLGKRNPHQLSGGQQQRVALARALVAEPRALLLDEPFSNLDAGLRARVREEVREILAEQKLTSVFVTHDQEEALSVADVVAVVNEGQVEQIGTPGGRLLAPDDPLGRELSSARSRCCRGRRPTARSSASWGSCPTARATPVRSTSWSGPSRWRSARSSPPTAAARRQPSSPAASSATTSWSSCELPSGSVVKARRLGFPAWHPGDNVRIWIEGPADVLARDWRRQRSRSRSASSRSGCRNS